MDIEFFLKSDISKTVCFSGHRPDRLPQRTNEMDLLQQKLDDAIESAIARNKTLFITGGMSGFDTLAAEILLEKKIIYPHIRCIEIVPFLEGYFATKEWSYEWIERQMQVMRQADSVLHIAEEYQKGVYYKRNRAMVDLSSEVIAYYLGGKGGTFYTINYAQEKNKNVLNLVSH
jgi:uncharacterized phage-like protein YoqJ